MDPVFGSPLTRQVSSRDHGSMFRPSGVIAGPVTDVMLDLGIRLEFLVPSVAILSMAAGILAARIIDRRR